MEIKTWLIAVLLVSVSRLATQAALVEADWKTAGDKLLLQDAATGLEWLDLTETLAQSFEQVSAELGPGDSFEGFSTASTADVEVLFMNAGIPDIGAQTVANYLPIRLFQFQHGITFTSFGISTNAGITNTQRIDLDGRLGRDIAFTQQRLDVAPQLGLAVLSDQDVVPLNTSSFFAGVWLYRSITPVPAPSAMLLFGSGLIGMVGWRWWTGRLQQGCEQNNPRPKA